MKNIRIIITGGSGFIGTNAVSFGIKNGWEIKNIDINPPKMKEHRDYWIKGDICNKDEIYIEMEKFNPTHILHLAAKTGMDLKSLEDVRANTEGVKNIIDISNNIKSLKRIIFTSSLLVCKNGYIPNNDNDYCPPNIYGRSKTIGEQIVKQTNTNFEWIIVRPTSIWGPWFEHSYLQFFQMINRNLYFHPSKADKIKPKSYVGNTVYMMFKLLFAETSKVNKQVFYLADYPQGTTREWAECIDREMGKRKILTIPFPILELGAAFGDFF